MPRKNWSYASPEDQAILTALEQTEILFLVQNLAYDDKMIIRYADQKKGVILSNDRYRDVQETNPELMDQIKNRFLNFICKPKLKMYEQYGAFLTNNFTEIVSEHSSSRGSMTP